MMLSDTDISKALELHIGIEPFHEEQLQPCSYDLTLANCFSRYTVYGQFDPTVVDVAKYARTVYQDKTLLRPGELLLASTRERVSLCEHYGAKLEGKSSLARLGLMVHTAGFVDAGFHGQLTLEITNHFGQAIWLTEGMPIAQICFYELKSPATKTYQGKYQGQKGVQPSRYVENFDERQG